MAFPTLPRSTGASLDSEGSLHHRQASLSSFPPSRSSSQMSFHSRPSRSPNPLPTETDRSSNPSLNSKTPSLGPSPHSSLATPRQVPAGAAPQRRLRSQYPRGSAANHVEYILVASFDIDRGPVMEHQYPVAITGDEHMLAELMLPDQAHARHQDWTIFFLHKDSSPEDEHEARQARKQRRARRRRRRQVAASLAADEATGTADQKHDDKGEKEERINGGKDVNEDDHVDENRNGIQVVRGEREGKDEDDSDVKGEDKGEHGDVNLDPKESQDEDDNKVINDKGGSDADEHEEAGDEDYDDDANDDEDEDADDDYDDYDDDDDDDSSTEDEFDSEGAPLVYVLNLVNTKHDKTVKRGAIVKAMAICTRHPFLHIYKPLLLLALEEYFKSPSTETLSMLYDSVNAMDLSLMPKLSLLERNLLLASENKDLFVEKFERMIQVRIAEDRGEPPPDGPLDRSRSPHVGEISRTGTKAHIEGGHSAYSVARDTHEFESKVIYKGIPIPIKVPTAVMPETVGDFSLIKLIQNFSEPHAKSPQPFALHPHLTTNGANTHPIIVLVNALLTQKRVIFLGHNMPSGEVAEAVLAACALASGGMLRGFTRHAFPYTDLTKVDDLLNVPGFIAGVTNPTFELHPEWWDLLCDLPSGRIKISSKIETVAITQGLVSFQQRHPGLATIASGMTNIAHDLTGDGAFIQEILRSIAARRGERAIRAKWRDWVNKFTRIAAQFEESVYGSSALYPGGQGQEPPMGAISGHGYVWPDDTAKYKELASNVTRIEGWRNTRSYYSFIQDLSRSYNTRPLKGLDLAHMHDRLRMQRLSPDQSRDIYLTLVTHIHSYDEICLLLDVAPESHAGLFYIALGLFHKDREVRFRTAELLERVAEHEAGQHWWKSMNRFGKLAFDRLRRELAAAAAELSPAQTENKVN